MRGAEPGQDASSGSGDGVRSRKILAICIRIDTTQGRKWWVKGHESGLVLSYSNYNAPKQMIGIEGDKIKET